jgi:hypothetical protein
MVPAAVCGDAGQLCRGHRNRRDALALSDDLLRLLHHRIATEVKDYLAPAADMARLAAGVLQDQAFGTVFPSLTEVLSRQVLEAYPQLAMVYIADPKGNFLMQKKCPMRRSIPSASSTPMPPAAE